MSFQHFHTYNKQLKIKYLNKKISVESVWNVSKCVESIFSFPHIPHIFERKTLNIKGVDVWKVLNHF